MRPYLRLLTAAFLLTAAPTFAQRGFGTLDPSQPTGITTDQIIQKMGVREAEFKDALNSYIFTRDVKFNTISDDNNKPDGEYRQVTNVTFDKTGHRAEQVTFAPGSTIERVIMTENDMKDIEQRLPFILTAPELPQYNITYLGKQHVDTLDTYVFDVTPKAFEKGKRYFQGKVWVDQQDNEIVLCQGLNVPQDTRPDHADLSPPFITYYQQIDGKYWFPTYTKAEGTLHFPPQNGAMGQDVHVRTIIHYTDYKRFHTSVTIQYAGSDVTDERNKPDATKPAPTETKPK
ncbi:MAG: hypothetical protein V4555_18785 [Acidobacteriota bacterium]